MNRIERGLAESARRPAITSGVAQQETFRQSGQILRTLTQRRHVDADHVETIKQILSELAVLHHLAQIAIGRSDQAHVGATGDRVADALVFAILDEAQQLWLQRQRHIADLVEKQRAAFGLIHAAQLVFDRAGEGAFLVPEQFAFQQLGRQRRTVDRNELFLRTRTAMMDQACRHAFAGTALAEEQHGGIGIGDLAQGFQQLLHRRTRAVHLRAAGRAVLFFQRFDTLLQPPRPNLLARGHAQLLRRTRFDQIIRRSRANGIERAVDRRMRGDDHHLHPRCGLAQFRQQIQTGGLAQAQIEKAQIEHIPLYQLLGLLGIRCRGDVMSGVFQAITKRAQDVLFVVDQQYAGLFFQDFSNHRCSLCIDCGY